MDVVAAIMTRRSVRQYRKEPMPVEDLRTILECARQAPSAGNRQPLRLVAVTDPLVRRTVAAACQNQAWIADAAAVVVGVGDPTISEAWYPVDVAIALENLVLAATSLGYGTCWIGAFNRESLNAVLGVPEGQRIVAVVAVGRAAQQPEARPRRSMAEFASLQRYDEQFSL